MKLVVITDTGEQIEARCAECAHWEARIGDYEYTPMAYEAEGDDLDPPAPHRRCLVVVHLNHKGTSPVDTARPAYVMDASGYSAHLWTRPEFYCQLFAAKETP